MAPRKPAGTAATAAGISTPQPPQSTPQTVGGMPGGADYSAFIWQQLSEIQRTLGDVQREAGKTQQAVEQLRVVVEKQESKADETHEKIHSINIKIAVAGAVVALTALVAGWIFKEVWDVAKPTLVQRLTAADPQGPGAAKSPAAPASGATP